VQNPVQNETKSTGECQGMQAAQNCMLSEMLDSGSRAHLILIPSSARDAARTHNDPVAQKGKASLSGDQNAARCRDDPDKGGVVFWVRQITTGAADYYGRERLPLAREHACQNGILHSLEREQTSARITDSNTDPDIQLPRLCQSTVHDPIGILQR
jgi:hypothetical protein